MIWSIPRASGKDERKTHTNIKNIQTSNLYDDIFDSFGMIIQFFLNDVF